jgi:hypothetical protein
MSKIGSRTAVIVLILLLGSPTALARQQPHKPADARRITPVGSTPPPRAGTAPTKKTVADKATARLEKLIKKLEARLSKLQSAHEDLEVGQLIMESKVESVTPAKKAFKTKTFLGHARALQGLNPEISVTGDLAGVFYLSDSKEYGATERSSFRFRGLGLHFQADLDPFSYMKAAISISPTGVVFGEAYAVWTNVGGVMNLMAGKFRQQLGVVNRWHKHGLDQYDFPLMLTEPFGPGGLNQTGLSFQFLLPKLTAHANELTVQITNGENGKAFSGDTFSVPTTLVYFKNYWDLSNSTYLELGLTGIVGFNNKRGAQTTAEIYTDEAATIPFNLYTGQGTGTTVPLSFAPMGDVVDEKWRVTAFGGANLTLFWEPMKKGKYLNFLWRSSFLYGYKRLAPDSARSRQDINWMGGYSYVQAKVSRTIELGLRGDLVRTFEVSDDKNYMYQVVPYLIWWQSPWLRFRLEYNYHDGNAMKAAHRAILQVVFAAGPHKHDRY